MADTKAIQNRIKSVGDTRKITNAMYLISSTKLRKARKSLDETSPFFAGLKSEISRIVRNVHVGNSRYFLSAEDPDPEEGKCGILVITADKGLAGAYNQNVIKKALEACQEHPNHELYVIGEYGRHYFSAHDIPYDQEFYVSEESPNLYEARATAGYIMDKFDRGELSQVYIVYTNFKNAITSEVVNLRLVPFAQEHFDQEGEGDEEFEEYEYIPSPIAVMEKCIPVYCIGMIYSILVYAFCCEQNDRMMAMDSANQNADKLLKDLTLKYNRLRQNGITQEITEISASVKAADRK